MSLGNLLARLTTSYGSHSERVRGRVAVAKAVMAALPRCATEALESRVLLPDAGRATKLFDTARAFFTSSEPRFRVRR